MTNSSLSFDHCYSGSRVGKSNLRSRSGKSPSFRPLACWDLHCKISVPRSMSRWASPARSIRWPLVGGVSPESRKSAELSVCSLGRLRGTPAGSVAPPPRTRPRPPLRPSSPGPALSADRLCGAARLAPPPPSARAGGVAGEGRDVLGGGGPGDGIGARRAEARSLTAPAGDCSHPGRWVWAREEWRSRTGWVGGGARSPPPRSGLGRVAVGAGTWGALTEHEEPPS